MADIVNICWCDVYQYNKKSPKRNVRGLRNLNSHFFNTPRNCKIFGCRQKSDAIPSLKYNRNSDLNSSFVKTFIKKFQNTMSAPA